MRQGVMTTVLAGLGKAFYMSMLEWYAPFV